MNQQNANQMIKQKALASVRGNFGALINILIMSGVFAFFIKNVISFLFYPTNLLGTIIFYILYLLFTAMSGVLSCGSASIYLKLNCNENFQLSDLFYGFKNDLKTAYLLSMLFTVINFICFLPLLFYTPEATFYEMELYLLQTTIYFGMFIGCNLLYFLVTIIISQVFYVKVDFPELSFKGLLKKNLQLMKGNWSRYLMLHISFLPLLLLVVGSCGIAYLWVGPYIKSSTALFYLDMMQSS